MPILPSVAVLITRFNIGPLTLQRRVAPVRNAFGAFNAQPAANIVLNPVAAHTVTGTELDQVPEADRNSEVVEFYTTLRLEVAQVPGQAVDVISYQGRQYRIIAAHDYDLQGSLFIGFGQLEEVQAVA